MTHFGRLLCVFTVVFVVVYSSGTFAALDPIVVPLVALTLSSLLLLLPPLLLLLLVCHVARSLSAEKRKKTGAEQ